QQESTQKERDGEGSRHVEPPRRNHPAREPQGDGGETKSRQDPVAWPLPQENSGGQEHRNDRYQVYADAPPMDGAEGNARQNESGEHRQEKGAGIRPKALRHVHHLDELFHRVVSAPLVDRMSGSSFFGAAARSTLMRTSSMPSAI